MPWYHLNSTNDPRFAELAARFRLHPLHVEDAGSPAERVKLETASHYTFALLKTVALPADGDEFLFQPICIFASHAQENPSADDAETSFLLVIADTAVRDVAAVLRPAEQDAGSTPPMRLLYRIFDALVDSYFPLTDALDDQIDELEAQVVMPHDDLLNDIFSLKRRLVDARRLFVGTRDASMHLQRDPGVPANDEHQLYLRDLYDHTTRLLDTVDTQRDLLNNALDIYLSSIANRTNEVMKVLTVLSTIALPALVVTGIFGMNVKGLPFANSPHGMLWVGALTLALTAALLVLLRRVGWL